MKRDRVVGLKHPEDARPQLAPIGLEGGDQIQDAVRDLITTYHSLNPSTIDTLSSEPSPLEFMRYVSLNRPFVIRSGARSWPAVQNWNASYLLSAMHDNSVNVAITPHGNADSIVTLDAHTKLFVKPFETPLPFADVLRSIQQQEASAPSPDVHQQTQPSTPPIFYAQTQNDNLRAEYTALFADVPDSVPWARIALQKPPDAINFWLGNSRSTTALHKDPYENIYIQVLGQKHFTLLPPICAPCVNEMGVLAATYRPRSSAPAAGYDDLVMQVDEPSEYVPFAAWDPDSPERNGTKYSRLAQPMRVTLGEGDVLYLPALWYHKVAQTCDEEGLCCAVNYWYDVDFGGGFWSMANFVRGVGLLSLRDGDGDGEDGRGASDDAAKKTVDGN
ncbi:Clavaminate synthase-like protein [Polyplosphaeria fusca]|uniref:Clavaminate synthase-like protein n=1 Tax=Polyplosphaeria fusca TaxID=682080 RepID=A0A9P4V271_9PLEO|nr:Clavaminate synthase-like protein [Polyplosphaeria fusca]